MNPLDMVTGAEDLDLTENGEGTGGEAEVVAAAVAAEVAEIGTQLEEQGTQIEKLAEAVVSLDETAEEVLENVEGMESMLASGNFSSIGFANIFNRTNRLNVKLGGTDTGSRLGAESISDATTAQMMARTGIEGFMDSVKSWGKKAIEYIKHIFNSVIAFIVGLFSEAAGLQKQADNLEARLGEGKIHDKVKLGSWNIYFNYEANGFADATGGEAVGTFGAGLAGLLDEIKSAQEVNVASFSTHYKALTTQLEAVVVAGKGAKKSKKAEAGKDVVIGQYAGIRAMASFKTGEIKDEKDCAEASRALRLVIGKDPEASKKLAAGKEVKAKVDVAGLKAVLKKVRDTAHMLREGKVTKKFTGAERDRIVGMLSAAKATDEKVAEKVNKTIEVVKATYAASIAMFTVFQRHSGSEARAALAGVSAHIKVGGSHDTGKK